MRFIILVSLLIPVFSNAQDDTTYQTYDGSFIVRCDCNTKDIELELYEDKPMLGQGKYFWAAKMNAQHNCSNYVTRYVNSVTKRNYSYVEGAVYNCVKIAEPNKLEPTL